jgi:hypothetical protein
MICSQCKQEARVNLVDTGFGSLNVYGTWTHDKCLVYVSACCEADLTDEDGNYLDFYDVQDILKGV